MEDNQDTRILAKIERIRGWLRMHGDYQVTLDLWGLYGCYNLTVKHLSRTLKISNGMHLEKRLDEAIVYLEDASND